MLRELASCLLAVSCAGALEEVVDVQALLQSSVGVELSELQPEFVKKGWQFAKDALIDSGKQIDSMLKESKESMNISFVHSIKGKTEKRCDLTAATAGTELFTVDNSKLGATTNGLGYRFQKSSWDRDTMTIARWGSTVRGLKHKDGWVQVGNCFLPMKVKDITVLRPASTPSALMQLSGTPKTEEQVKIEEREAREAEDKSLEFAKSDSKEEEGTDENGVRVGDQMEIIVVSGPQAGKWLKCYIESRDPATGNYNLHLPRAPNKYRHVKNIPFEALRRPDETESSKSDGILIFYAVTSQDDVMDLVTANIDHLRESFSGRADIFMVHIDGGKQEWLDRNETWYNQNIQYSEEHLLPKAFLPTSAMVFSQGYYPPSLKLAKNFVPELLSKRQYDWVWPVDEGLDFHNVDLDRLFKDAEESGALIVSPSLKFEDTMANKKTQKLYFSGCTKKYPMCFVHIPQPACRYRYTNYVSALFPILKPDSFKEMFTGCDNCDNQVDKIWCSRTATQMVQAPEESCAIVDSVTMTHKNAKALRKWEEVSKLHDAAMDVAQAHPGDWIDSYDVGVFKCVE